MASPVEHQYEAVLALLPHVIALRDASFTYLDRLGTDRGVSARISRRSHFGLLQSPVLAFQRELLAREPAIYDDQARASLAEQAFGAALARLEHRPESDRDGWDAQVAQIHEAAKKLEGALRLVLAQSRSTSEPAIPALAQSRSTGEPVIPGYEILDTLGRGGFGAVYRAKDGAGVERAVKLLAPSALAPQTSADERFRREGRLLSTVDHPGIVRYLHFADGPSGWYLVMELVRGAQLSAWAKDHDDTARVGAILQVLDALESLHACEIVHRDLKPSNILVEAATGQVVIVDLGLGWLLGGGDATLTRGSAWSAAYAPPEVIADPGQSRSPLHDIYSVGVILYEVLAGQRPQHQNRTPLAHHRPQLAPLDAVVARALAPAETRYPSAVDFAAGLRAALAGVSSPWSAVFAAIESVRSSSLRTILAAGAQAGEAGEALDVAVITSGLYDALRIHFTRSFRSARGSDAPGNERWLPARLSLPASKLFGRVPELWQEPVLHEDKYGEAALTRLGFGIGELAIFEEARRYALQRWDSPRDRSLDLPAPPLVDRALRGLLALTLKVRELEDREPALVAEFVRLAGADEPDPPGDPPDPPGIATATRAVPS